MCGIFGFIGTNLLPHSILVEALYCLEYRGYDSAGLGMITEKDGLCFAKAKGRIESLDKLLSKHPLQGDVGIAHTRWATHGKPSELNAHPHLDSTLKFAVVHNGIIENCEQLKEELISKGHTDLIESETDTAVIPYLIAAEYAETLDLVLSVQRAAVKLVGSFSLAVICQDEPNTLIAVRHQSPLIIGLSDSQTYITSDVSAILKYTKNTYCLNDNEMAVLGKNSVRIIDIVSGKTVEKAVTVIEWDYVQATKNGFEHYMLKEIYEQPQSIKDTLALRIIDNKVVLKEINLSRDHLCKVNKIHIVACGTAMHAGLVGLSLIRSCARITCIAEVASEFRYSNPILDSNSLVIIVSQSGETADSLAALREAKRLGAHVIGITNVVGSSVHRESDSVILTRSGPEVSVASTKAYTAMLAVFYLIALHLADIYGTMPSDVIASCVEELLKLPQITQDTLKIAEQMEMYAKYIISQPTAFFVGRGLDFCVAVEGSLKLKEISYIHSEA
ncbi:hypothetical protein GEMRC1_001404 [Eukaryota sp. GEM-RC1]